MSWEPYTFEPAIHSVATLLRIHDSKWRCAIISVTVNYVDVLAVVFFRSNKHCVLYSTISSGTTFLPTWHEKKLVQKIQGILQTCDGANVAHVQTLNIGQVWHKNLKFTLAGTSNATSGVLWRDRSIQTGLLLTAKTYGGAWSGNELL